MLSKAVADATAGEIHRAAKFLEAARSVRVGKRDVRNKWRGKSK